MVRPLPGYGFGGVKETVLQRRSAAILASAMGTLLALAGCGTTVHEVRSAAASSGTAAVVSGRCATGVVTVDPETGASVSFVPFTDLSAFHPGPDVHGGYQLTLTDTSAVTAEVDGFSVVFDQDGSEVGSATAGPFTSPESITHGQSLTWTKTTSAMNVGTQGAVATDDTCALARWTHP
jgi:hypothetical protein